MFTIVDFSNPDNSNHIKHYEASSSLVTFNIQFHTFGFTRMPFGLTIVGNVYQCKLDAVFRNLDVCTGIAYNMIIWGERPDGTDHEKYLT